MEWSAKGYEGGCATSRAATAKAGDMSAEFVSAGLPGGAVASEEEFAHLETCLEKTNRPPRRYWRERRCSKRSDSSAPKDYSA